MKQLLQSLYEKLKQLASRLYSMSPFAAGMALGYFGHPFIKLTIDAASLMVRHLIG